MCDVVEFSEAQPGARLPGREGYYCSLYGHLAEFLVRKGDYVKAGQAIGVAGDTGSMVGVSVYFEIRYKTKPVDPLQWLSRR